MPDSYLALEDRFARLSHIEGATAVLRWDRAVTMPRGGAAGRGDQLATLARLGHDILTAPETGDLLAAADDGDPSLDDWQRANLREMRRIRARAVAVEPRLVEAVARATTRSEMVWREAKATNDYPLLLPHLREVLALIQEQAAMVGTALGLAPFDALIDEYQPGLDSRTVDRLFGELAAVLPAMTDRALARQRPAIAPSGPFALSTQRQLGRRMAELLGLPDEVSRLDESAHPFSEGVPGDVRITTRYREHDVLQALFATVHETGHALYTNGQPARWRGQPVGDARGMVVHESQSLLVEMQVCRGAAFASLLAGELAAAFGPDPAFAADNLLALCTRVERSLIRVEADELTYPLHVMLRYRLEKRLLSGDLDLADLPDAWRAGMQELLGVTPPDDRLGCMQDIHWQIGAFGYFPCYTLGAMLAAQLYQAAERALPGLPQLIAKGEFRPLVGWLGTHIHGRGCEPAWPEIVVQATGTDLSTAPFLAHLRRRYLGEAD